MAFPGTAQPDRFRFSRVFCVPPLSARPRSVQDRNAAAAQFWRAPGASGGVSFRRGISAQGVSVKKRKASVKSVSKAKPSAPLQRDAIDAMVAAAALALDLPIDPAWQANVKFNLQLILRHAALVDEFPLPDDAEPAPVF